jgi:Ca2+-binding RTX toxin-like protein
MSTFPRFALNVCLFSALTVFIERTASAYGQCPVAYNSYSCNTGSGKICTGPTAGGVFCSLDKAGLGGLSTADTRLVVAMATGGGSTTAVAYGVDSQGVTFCCRYADMGVYVPAFVEAYGTDDDDHSDDMEFFVDANISAYGYKGDDYIAGSGNSQGDHLDGGDGDDTIYGYGGPDEIRGGAGYDILHGGLGGDEICGDGDDDELYGEQDNDDLYGGDGDDDILINGGTGASDHCEVDSDTNCDAALYSCPL